MEDDYGDNLKSKFNSGYFISLRLHNLWIDANRNKRKGAYSSWNGDLDSVWCELGGDVKEGGKEDKQLLKINEALGKLSPIVNWSNNIGFKKLDKNQRIKQTKQYKILLIKELFLRRLQNKQGKGTAYLDNSDDYMDG